MAVIISHCFLADTNAFRESHLGIAHALASPGNLFLYIMGRSFEAGRAAVMLFFVLSGFVLARSLQDRHVSYATYAVKRVARIYPLFLFVILYSYTLHRFMVVQNLPAQTGLHDLLGAPPVSPAILLKHLLMYGNNANNALDPAMWTIVHEMRISLIFPFILMAVIRFRWLAIAAFGLLSFLCTFAIFRMTGMVASGVFDATVARSLITSGYYVVYFACGAFLAIERGRVAAGIGRLARWQKIVLLAFCLYCFLRTDFDRSTLPGAAVDYLRGLGALALIALALGSRALRRALGNRLLLWLGHISYSLYLVHYVILFVVHALNEALGRPLPIGCASLAVIGLSLLVADSTTRSIEQPFIRLGRKLGAPAAMAGLHRPAYGDTKLASSPSKGM